jgi:phosphate uptake regulator
MLKKIIELFSKESLLDLSNEDCKEMLEMGLQMFIEATQTLRHRDDNLVNIDIYQFDKKVNKLERSVRRKILTHLSVGSRLDVNQGLILISIVIDLERIGDYTKNIYELAKARQEPLNPGPWTGELSQTESDIVKSFESLIVLFSQSDPNPQDAVNLLQQLGHYNLYFDEKLLEIIKGNVATLSAADASILVLYMRYLKRITCHLSNVASSLVNPMPRIGFKPKMKNLILPVDSKDAPESEVDN